MQPDAAPRNSNRLLSSPNAPPVLDRLETKSRHQLVEKDEALIIGISSGSEGSFLLFYRRFAPAAYSMVLRILKDQREAEDALQEAFLQIWKRRATYDAGRSKLFTWVIMIARGKAIDRLRARDSYRRATAAAAEEMSVVPPEDEGNGLDFLESMESRVRIRAALDRLNKDQRVAIDLAFFGGMSQSEISRKLSQPLGTVKARIRRGLASLRGVLAEDGNAFSQERVPSAPDNDAAIAA